MLLGKEQEEVSDIVNRVIFVFFSGHLHTFFMKMNPLVEVPNHV